MNKTIKMNNFNSFAGYKASNVWLKTNKQTNQYLFLFLGEDYMCRTDAKFPSYRLQLDILLINTLVF